MYFCFETFVDSTGTCSGSLRGVRESPEACCLQAPRGLGAGAYLESGTSENCFSCMNVIGEADIQLG